MNIEIESVIGGCINGDKKSQEILFKHYYSILMSVCVRYGKSEDDTQDLLQSGFIKVYNNLNKITDFKTVNSWVKRVVINNCIDYYRKNKRKANISGPITEIDIIDEDTYEIEESKYTVKNLLSALSNLSNIERTVFNMFVIDNYGHQEISEILDININTSKTILRRSRKKLKNYLLKNVP